MKLQSLGPVDPAPLAQILSRGYFGVAVYSDLTTQFQGRLFGAMCQEPQLEDVSVVIVQLGYGSGSEVMALFPKIPDYENYVYKAAQSLKKGGGPPLPVFKGGTRSLGPVYLLSESQMDEDIDHTMIRNQALAKWFGVPDEHLPEIPIRVNLN